MKFVYPFARPSVTATIALVTDNNDFLCGLRGRADGAYAGYFCVPGGFLDSKVEARDNHLSIVDRIKEFFGFKKRVTAPGETIEETAVREIFEETGLMIDQSRLELVTVLSDPDTDPRCHVVNVCYLVRISETEVNLAVAGDDLAELKRFTYDEVTKTTLAFNHNKIIDEVWKKL